MQPADRAAGDAVVSAAMAEALTGALRASVGPSSASDSRTAEVCMQDRYLGVPEVVLDGWLWLPAPSKAVTRYQ